MALAVCKRCSGIDSHSEGVVDVLAAMVEVNVQHTHDDAFSPQVPAKQSQLHRWRLSSWEVHTTCVHGLGRVQAMQRHR